MLDNIHIKDPDALLKKVEKLRSDGKHKLHVVSDFDKTLTRAFSEGKNIMSTYAVLREGTYLGPEYSKKDFELFDEYYPQESDISIPLATRAVKMDEWWAKHYQLMVDFGVTKDMLTDVVHSGALCMRDNTVEFLHLLRDNSIPMLILSAGIGNVIEQYLQENDSLHSNIHVIANFVGYDEEGKIKNPLTKFVHSLNKNEVQIQGTPYADTIKARKNVILLGDALSDLDMTAGIEHDTILRIGFLNEKVDERIKEYEEAYDVLILNDGPMDYIVDLIKDICKH